MKYGFLVDIYYIALSFIFLAFSTSQSDCNTKLNSDLPFLRKQTYLAQLRFPSFRLRFSPFNSKMVSLPRRYSCRGKVMLHDGVPSMPLDVVTLPAYHLDTICLVLTISLLHNGNDITRKCHHDPVVAD